MKSEFVSVSALNFILKVMMTESEMEVQEVESSGAS